MTDGPTDGPTNGLTDGTTNTARCRVACSFHLSLIFKKHQLQKAWIDCGLTITPKVHLIIEHLPEACRFYGFGMALLNESAAESVHADFDRHYQGYIVKDLNNDNYRQRLLHAIKTYNANHV